MPEKVEVNNPNPNVLQDLTKVMADFNNNVKSFNESKKTEATQKEEIDKMKKDMSTLLATQEKERKDAAERKAINDSTTKESVFGVGYEVKEILNDAESRSLTFDNLLLRPEANRHLKSIQSRASDCYLLGKMIATRMNMQVENVIPRLKIYQNFMKDTESVRKALSGNVDKNEQKAMSIGSGEAGFDWIPTGFSADLIEIFHLQMVISAMHPNFTIPQKMTSWTVPGTSSDLKAFLTQAAASDNPTKFKASTRLTRNVVFTPQKFTAATVLDIELEEDSIIPVLPNLKVNIVQAIRRAIDDTIINGDRAGTMDNTDMHGDTINVQSPGKGWDGWRKFITDHGSVRTNAAGAATFTGMIDVMRNMGKYAINLSDLSWVTGPNGYFDGLLKINKVQTVDLFGPNAIVQKGELARLMGVPIIVTEQERQDLKTTTGVSGGASSAYNDTSIQLIWRPGFAFGMKRKITSDAAQIRRTDSLELWSTMRADFQANYTTGEPILGEITNVA